MIRFWLMQVVGISGLFALWQLGVLEYYFTSDSYFLTHGVVLIFAIGLIAGAMGHWQIARNVESQLTAFGLLGTVVGFSLALPHLLAGDDIGTAGPALSTALHTTIAGLVGTLWLHYADRARASHHQSSIH